MVIGQNCPYKAPEAVTAKKKTWHHYIRRYSSTVEAKGDTEQALLSLAAKVPLARMTREALSYIQRNFLIETVLKHPDRAETTRVWNG